VTFERFDEQARLTVVLAQEECRLLGHDEIGADHLLVAVARVDEAILGLAPERLRDVVARLRGVRQRRESADTLPFSAEAMAAIERADDQATSRGHTRVRPGHVLLAVLGAGNTASRILSEVGLSEHKARAWAEHAAAHPASGSARASPQRVAGRVSALDEGRFEDAIRDGHPVMVRLHNTPPLGDVGNALVDARLLKLMLAADGRLGRMLRAHGVDEATVDAALKPPA
jgi:ATP-dependent Clp protease ATP-binding subunit ClpA